MSPPMKKVSTYVLPKWSLLEYDICKEKGFQSDNLRSALAGRSLSAIYQWFICLCYFQNIWKFLRVIEAKGRSRLNLRFQPRFFS